MVPSDAEELHEWLEYISEQCRIRGSDFVGGATA